jgi:hypothetical protein
VENIEIQVGDVYQYISGNWLRTVTDIKSGLAAIYVSNCDKQFTNWVDLSDLQRFVRQNTFVKVR